MSAVTVRVAACLALVAWLSLPAVALPAMVTSQAEEEQQTNCSKHTDVCVHGVCDKAANICKCDRGYEGRDCSVPVCSKSPCPPTYDCVMRSYSTKGFVCVHNPCASHRCQAGEICLIDMEKPEGYKCTEDPCSSIRCYNEGVCVFDKQAETVGCECIPPFDPRTDCFWPRGCHPDLKPCQNGGICNDKFQCECPEGYSGMFCGILTEA